MKKATSRLTYLAGRIRDEANNISPKNDDGSGGNSGHAPLMRQWARTLDDIVSELKE